MTLYDTSSGQQCISLKDLVFFIYIFKGTALKSFLTAFFPYKCLSLVFNFHLPLVILIACGACFVEIYV